MQLPHAAGFYQELGIFRAREFCIVVAQEASSMLPSRIDSQISFSVARLQDCDRLNGGIMIWWRSRARVVIGVPVYFLLMGQIRAGFHLKRKKTIHAAIAFRWRWKCSVDARGWQILFPTRRRLESWFSTSCFLFCDVLFNCNYEVSANNCHCLRDQTLCLTMLLNIGIN